MFRFVFLASALLFTMGCQESVPQIGGISGQTSFEGHPLPERTTVSFFATDRDEGFMTQVDASGHYHYKPASGVPVSPGTYKVVITPPARKTIIEDGVDVVDPNDKADYSWFPKPYLDPKTTPLEVTIDSTSQEYDIELK